MRAYTGEMLIMDVKKIEDIFNKFDTLPFLFVGAGFSVRYLNSYTWNELLKQIANKISGSNNRYELNKYLDAAEHNYPRVGTLLEKDFNSKFYDQEIVFDLTEEEELEIENRVHSPFKKYVAKLFSEIDVCSRHEELEILKRCRNKVAGIITTNYDTLLENIFEDHVPLVGQDKILSSRLLEISEIYKIHGSTEQPNSIVITEEDYFEYNKKHAYLSAKLLTIFVENPVVFLGYGLGDENVINILNDIRNCLTKEQLDKWKDRLIFVEYVDDSSKEKITVYNHDGLVFTHISLHDFSPLYESIEKIKDGIPVGILRKLKDKVYNYIHDTGESTAEHKVCIVDIDSETLSDEDIAIYIGSKSKIDSVEYMSVDGVTGIEGFELFEDALRVDSKYPEDLHNSILAHAVPKIIKQMPKTVLPLQRYIRNSSEFYTEKYAFTEDVLNKVCNKSIQKSYVNYPVYHSLDELVKNEKAYYRIFLAMLKSLNYLDIEEVGNYLRSLDFKQCYKSSPYSTFFRKLIALYDYYAQKNSGLSV